MDEATPRTRSTSRRMASAKGGGTTKRSSPSRSSKKSQEPEVSPARWAGVALVIAAIFGAVFLAMISPSETGQPGEQSEPAIVAEVPSPSVEPTVIDVPLPVVAPVITIPFHGEQTRETEFAVTVDIPDVVAVPKKRLELYVYYGDKVKTVDEGLKPGTEEVVHGVRLVPGENTLTAALGTRGVGPGPTSEPVVITLDEDLPELEITSPKNKLTTHDENVLVEFTSEVGAKVRVVNKAVKKFAPDEIVGEGGKGQLSVPLKYGKNRIEVTSTDQAGLPNDDEVIVTRLDGRPTITLKVPDSVSLPQTIKIIADVTDFDDQPMPDATVDFTLSGANRVAQSENRTTNERGRAVWNVEVAESSSPATTLELAVVVVSPTGHPRTRDKTINVK